MRNYMENILNELSNNAKKIDTDELSEFVAQIKKAGHIFLAGAGRSGIVVQAFANRLLHLGFSISIIGEISSPHSQEGDLMIICSGSGETDSLKILSSSAQQNNVDIALVTMKKHSTIARQANTILTLPGITKYEETKNDHQSFSQPMGTNFEQLAFLTFDSLILNLMDKIGETSETMLKRHANFE